MAMVPDQGHQESLIDLSALERLGEELQLGNRSNVNSSNNSNGTNLIAAEIKPQAVAVEPLFPPAEEMTKRKREAVGKLQIAESDLEATMSGCLKNENQRSMQGLKKMLEAWRRSEEYKYKHRPDKYRELAEQVGDMVEHLINLADSAGVFNGFDTDQKQAALAAAAESQALGLKHEEADQLATPVEEELGEGQSSNRRYLVSKVGAHLAQQGATRCDYGQPIQNSESCGDAAKILYARMAGFNRTTTSYQSSTRKICPHTEKRVTQHECKESGSELIHVRKFGKVLSSELPFGCLVKRDEDSTLSGQVFWNGAYTVVERGQTCESRRLQEIVGKEECIAAGSSLGMHVNPNTMETSHPRIPRGCSSDHWGTVSFNADKSQPELISSNTAQTVICGSTEVPPPLSCGGPACISFYDNIPGQGIHTLEGSPKYPDHPDRVLNITTKLEHNQAGTYGAKIEGWFTAPETRGDYRLLAHCDGHCRVYFSDIPYPGGKEKKVHDLTYRHGRRESSPFRLVAGKAYKVIGIVKADGGADYIRLGFKWGSTVAYPVGRSFFSDPANPGVTKCYENTQCFCDGTVVFGRRYASGNGGPEASVKQQLADKHLTKSYNAQAFLCSHRTFGGDPLGGVHKSCSCSPKSAVQPPSPNGVEILCHDAKNIPTPQNMGQPCLEKCEGTGLCRPFCGTGKCCKLGANDEGCSGNEGGTTDHTCTDVKPVETNDFRIPGGCAVRTPPPTDPVSSLQFLWNNERFGVNNGSYTPICDHYPDKPTAAPTFSPTQAPSVSPTYTPTSNPTYSPTTSPTDAPTASPTDAPTFSPTGIPTLAPTETLQHPEVMEKHLAQRKIAMQRSSEMAEQHEHTFKKVEALNTQRRERKFKRQTVEFANLQQLEAKVKDRFSYINKMSELCSAPPTESSTATIQEELRKYKLPPQAEQAAVHKRKMAQDIRNTMSVLARVNGMSDAQSLYALNQEAFKLLELSKKFENATPVSELGQIHS